MTKNLEKTAEKAKNRSKTSTKPKIIFFGNGPLAETTFATLEPHFDIIFHAKTREELKTAEKLKSEHPEAHGVLASYGVIIPKSTLELFEPEGILNLHPSLLPLYRGPSPIESAILAGDTDFGVSIMKLAPAMDAGPIYFQTTLKNLPLNKAEIYQKLAETGASWLIENLKDMPTPDDVNSQSNTPNVTQLSRSSLPTPVPQNDANATYTAKLTKNMGILDPTTDTAEQLYRKIVAFQGFPKAKYAFYGQNSSILAAHPLEPGETAPLTLKGSDGQILAIDSLQPDGKRPMDAKSFLNGYGKRQK